MNWDDTGSGEAFTTYDGYGTITYAGAITGDTDTVMLTVTNILQFLNDVEIDSTYANDVLLFTLPVGFRPSYDLYILPLYTDASSGTAGHLYHVDLVIQTNGEVWKHDDSVVLDTGDVIHLKGMCVNLACNHYMGALPVPPSP